MQQVPPIWSPLLESCLRESRPLPQGLRTRQSQRIYPTEAEKLHLLASFTGIPDIWEGVTVVPSAIPPSPSVFSVAAQHQNCFLTVVANQKLVALFILSH